jgi:hypothetical protein
MASIGLRALAIPFTPAPEIGAEWETNCDKCGIKIIYCTAQQEPNLDVKTCHYCANSE